MKEKLKSTKNLCIILKICITVLLVQKTKEWKIRKIHADSSTVGYGHIVREEDRMIKYEIYKKTVEIKYKDRLQIKPGCTTMDSEPELIEYFLNEKEALEALKKYESVIREFTSDSGLMYEVIEYNLEKNEYDQDGDFKENIEIFFSDMKIQVLDETYKLIAVFDNLADAEKLIDQHTENIDRENDYKISFS